jgi:PKD repeat protein
MDPKTIDMIYLHENNLSEELGVENLTVGNYTKLWIVVDGATGVLNESGEEITFDVPSGDLKIQQSFEIKEGNTTIDVEIDLDRSILYVPQGGVYKLRPQLGKMTVDHDDKESEDEEIEALEADAGDDYEAEVNETIKFKGKAEGGVKPYNWSWDFGDGNTSWEHNPEYAYNVTGTYTATLTVTDDEGTVAIDTALVTIEEES